MSYPTIEDIIAYLHDTTFAGVPGLPALDEDGDPVNLLKYEPGSIQNSPTLYTLLDSFTRETKGQVTMMRYRLLHRLVVQWQDNAEAEATLWPFVHSVPAAFDADPLLGGLITMGLARVGDGQSGFVVISNTKYRCLDFFSDIPTKAPYRSGI